MPLNHFQSVYVSDFAIGSPGCFKNVSGVLGQSCSSLALQYGLGATSAAAVAILRSINSGNTALSTSGDICPTNDQLALDTVCVAYGDSR